MKILSAGFGNDRHVKFLLGMILFVGLGVLQVEPTLADKPTVKFNKGKSSQGKSSQGKGSQGKGSQGKGTKSNAGKGIKSNYGKGTTSHGSQSRGSKGFTFSTKSTSGHNPTSYYRPSTKQKSKSYSGHTYDMRPNSAANHNHSLHDNHSYNSNLRSHNSNYRSYSSNYRSYPNHGSTFLNISPYGVGLNYNTYGGNYGGISTYYRPTNSYNGAAYPYSRNTYSTYSNPYLPSVGPSYPRAYSSQPTYVPGLTPTEAFAKARLLDDVNTSSTRVVNEHYPQVPTSAAARDYQLRAEQAFRSGDYSSAKELSEQALTLDRDNGRLLLFAGQTNFAVGDYLTAAKQIELATSRLKPDQWGFVVLNFRSFYGRNDYVSQTEGLNQHLADQPTDSDALALRGYHYGALGYEDSATKDLQRALESVPNHALASRLMPVFGSEVVIAPEEIQAPVPAENSKIIKLVPQVTGDGDSILIDGPSK